MKAPNVKQKQWMSDIAEYINMIGLGVLYHGYEERIDYQLHHVKGRSAKHNKIEIGHWYIIPVPVELHDVHSNNPFNVTHHKKLFNERYGPEGDIFLDLVEMMAEDKYEIPPPDVLGAIRDV